MSYRNDLLEEEIKNRLRNDFFQGYDSNAILGKIDFAVSVPQAENYLFETNYMLWAEAKKGNQADIYESFVQLIITIGKARTFDTYLPPNFLGAFDAEKIAFIPYNQIMDIFYESDFNWNIRPSDHSTSEFHKVQERVKGILERNISIYNYKQDEKELRRFIKQNFVVGKVGVSKLRINKNNFVSIYHKWCKEVRHSVNVDWAVLKKAKIYDSDFFLADILIKDNVPLLEKLNVVLQNNKYKLDRKIDELGLENYRVAEFNDNQKAHTTFWNRYIRPPKREYWDYIITRKDLLVPRDVRETKGSFFTPQRWVELSQQYLAEELGENWQDEYYIWDCAAGTGNLLEGLSNKYNIWASTIDKSDVEVMRTRVQNKKDLPLLQNHIFEFDFLNDSFENLPQGLKDIISDSKKRNKLVIYINPPYKEAGDAKQKSGTGKNKSGVATGNDVYSRYGQIVGKSALNELFAQFFIRIYQELQGVILAEFSKLKIQQGSNYKQFRRHFQAKLTKAFLVPADTFDNVKGKFPIGFKIWHTAEKEIFKHIDADVYNSNGELLFIKSIDSPDGKKNITSWIPKVKDRSNVIGMIDSGRADFQHANLIRIENKITTEKSHAAILYINAETLVQSSVFLAVRLCIPANWINDRDQFFAPKDGWQRDYTFLSDCLVNTIFHRQNRICSSEGTNHWIPFTESEVEAKECFDSHFMYNSLHNKIKVEQKAILFLDFKDDDRYTDNKDYIPIEHFSEEATIVMEAGRNLWRYYHDQPQSNPNASLYDIKLHFQGRDKKGKMNNSSTDKEYMLLIGALRDAQRNLAKRIVPKVYEYGFLMK